LPPRQHFAILDGLRGVAALAVLAHHTLDPWELRYTTPHAGLAVDFFFLLSGFVIAHAYEGRLLKAMSFRTFVTVRLIRLYPLILLGLLCGFIVFVLKQKVAHEPPLTMSTLVALVSGILILPTSVSMPQGWVSIFPYNIPSWSLFFELAVNFVYAAIVGWLTKRVLLVIFLISTLIVLVQSYALGGVMGGLQWNEFFYGVGRVLFPFFCGIYLFRLQTSTGGSRIRLPLALLAGTLLAVLLIPTVVGNWLYESLAVLIVFPAIVRLGAAYEPGPMSTSLCLFVGRLSYPLYILHYPVIRLFSTFIRSHDLRGVEFCAAITIEMISAIGFAFVAMKFFDEPTRAWLIRRQKTSKALVGRSNPA
jgi:peptidoglycan/LPS O-acetylase OafA/YrhL